MMLESALNPEDKDRDSVESAARAACWQAAEQVLSHVRTSGLFLFWRSFVVRGVEFSSPTTGAPNVADGPDQDIQFPQVVRVDGGWKVLDYGDGLVTSAGEDYGSYATGPFLETVRYMMACLVKRGVQRVAFEGDLSAKLTAWEECVHHKIACNFSPNLQESRRQRNLLRMLSEKNRTTPLGR